MSLRFIQWECKKSDNSPKTCSLKKHYRVQPIKMEIKTDIIPKLTPEHCLGMILPYFKF